MKFTQSSVFACAVCALAAFVYAGDPAPPAGPVTATMKTLTEVEPRIAVNSVNTPGDIGASFIIDQPGSYYLTGNITGEANKHGIEINSDDVTLDLSGFALTGVPNSLSGIRMADFQERVVIRNGAISDWGANGAQLAIDNGIVEDLRVSNCQEWGISNLSGFGTRLEGCTVYRNGAALGVAGGGIAAGPGAVIERCASYDDTGVGIRVGSGSVVSQCTARSTNADPNAVQTGAGIEVVGAGVVIKSCSSTSNAGVGIDAGSLANLVHGCGASNNVGANVVASGSSQVIDTVAP